MIRCVGRRPRRLTHTHTTGPTRTPPAPRRLTHTHTGPSPPDPHAHRPLAACRATQLLTPSQLETAARLTAAASAAAASRAASQHEREATNAQVAGRESNATRVAALAEAAWRRQHGALLAVAGIGGERPLLAVGLLALVLLALLLGAPGALKAGLANGFTGVLADRAARHAYEEPIKRVEFVQAGGSAGGRAIVLAYGSIDVAEVTRPLPHVPLRHSLPPCALSPAPTVALLARL